MTIAVGIRNARRGEPPGEIEFQCADGQVIIAVAHGTHPDEQNRMREALLLALAGTGIDVVSA